MLQRCCSCYVDCKGTDLINAHFSQKNILLCYSIQYKVETAGWEVVGGAPTTLRVKGLMMMNEFLVDLINYYNN